LSGIAVVASALDSPPSRCWRRRRGRSQAV